MNIKVVPALLILAAGLSAQQPAEPVAPSPIDGETYYLGCGSGSSQQKQHGSTSTVTVTAASGSLQHTASLTFTVQ
jgi:hypothetical protein